LVGLGVLVALGVLVGFGVFVGFAVFVGRGVAVGLDAPAVRSSARAVAVAFPAGVEFVIAPNMPHTTQRNTKTPAMIKTIRDFFFFGSVFAAI